MSFTMSLLTLGLIQLLAGISPGPSLVLVRSFSASVSRTVELYVVSGVLLATTVWACIAALGMEIILTQFPQYLVVIRLPGAAYLLWLGFKMIHSAVTNSGINFTNEVRSGISLVRRSLLDSMSTSLIQKLSLIIQASLWRCCRLMHPL